MPYVYKEAMKLEKKEKVGDGECVALVQIYAGAPTARAWREGTKVIGERTLPSAQRLPRSTKMVAGPANRRATMRHSI